MRLHHRIALAVLLLALSGCAETPKPQERVAASPYGVGGRVYVLPDSQVLQTWPKLPQKQIVAPVMMPYARVAVQMPVATLVPGLSADGNIQIDILEQKRQPRDAVLATVFADWRGREGEPNGSRYQYDPKSKLQANGGRRAYVKGVEGALTTLTATSADPKAPVFFLQPKNGGFDPVIECRRDVPPSHDVGEYCLLERRTQGQSGGLNYRILFPRSLLSDWAKLDAGAAAYLESAAMKGFGWTF